MNCKIIFGGDCIVIEKASYEEIFKRICDVAFIEQTHREHVMDLIRTNKINDASCYVRSLFQTQEIDFHID